jgi:hypothetical protein
MNLTSKDMEDLLYRRQFIIAPRMLDKFSSWQCAQISESLFVHAHPDLELTQVKNTKTELTLLGYIVDPDQTTLSNKDILERLLSELKNEMDIFKAVEKTGGRYVVVVNSPKTTFLFHDACGFRQVCHTDVNVAETWCASTAELIAEAKGFGKDVTAETEFINSEYYRTEHEPWWPGTSTPFAEIKQLLPNHYLDLQTRTVTRFWPWEKLQPMPFEETANQCADLMQRLVKSVAYRFKPALPITAGYDTRANLAASRDIKDQLYIYTFLIDEITRNHYDVSVPSRLLQRLGLTHHIISTPAVMTDPFKSLYLKSAGHLADERAGAIAQGLLAEYPPGRISFAGHASPIVRCVYHLFEYPRTIETQTLVNLAQMSGNRFAVREFSAWLAGARSIENEYGYKILDLFYWEQRAARWSAAGFLQWDVVHDRFDLFACRKLLALILGVESKFRRPPWPFRRKVIGMMWQEVLREPMMHEAEPLRERLFNDLKRGLSKVGLYEFARKCTRRYRYHDRS